MCWRCRKTAHPMKTEGWAQLLERRAGENETRGFCWLCPECRADVENFIFIAVETKPPYPVMVYVADELMIKLGQAEAADNLETYRKCLESDSWHGYEEQPKVHSLSLPDWVARKYF